MDSYAQIRAYRWRTLRRTKRKLLMGKIARWMYEGAIACTITIIVVNYFTS